MVSPTRGRLFGLRTTILKLLSTMAEIEADMAAHKEFMIATDVQVYFCDPSSPWQRGTNENTNRLLRQYFPKGTNLSGYSQTELNRTALELNQRPRKTLAFHSPAEALNDNVALTG
jgi:IS30 family transposase